MQWRRDSGEMFYEFCIEVAEPEECLELLDAPRFWPLCNCVYFLWVHTYGILFDNMAQVL